MRLCLYNTVISQNQETESLPCRMKAVVLDRKKISRFFLDLFEIFSPQDT
jgi:hypothetical protein